MTDETETETLSLHERQVARMVDLAEQMIAHMRDNQCPVHRVTGKLWVKNVAPGKTLVRIYCNNGSYAQLFVRDAEDEDEWSVDYRHEGIDRGAKLACKNAWNAAE